LNDRVDLGRMPPVDVVTKHLSPIVSSQRHNGRGYVTESIGPITFSQAGMALLLWASAGNVSALQQFALPPVAQPTSTPQPGQTP
jgi:hypothetical protein